MDAMQRLFGVESAGQHQTDRNESTASHQQPVPFREGKFSNVWDFITRPDGFSDEHFRPPRRMSEFQELEPGKIIRISDDGSRLHDRIMLVLRIRPTSLTCLTFCRHGSSRTPKDHWKVVEMPSTAADGLREEGTLHIALEPQWVAGIAVVSVQPGITINIQDAWNVERGLSIVMLGYVPPRSFQDLVEEHKKVYCESLDDAVAPDRSLHVSLMAFVQKQAAEAPEQKGDYTPERGKKVSHETKGWIRSKRIPR